MSIYKSYKTRSGVSLLISIVLISILLVFGMTVSAMVSESIRQSSGVNRSNQAFYAAEGALEEGLYENVDKGGAGYTSNVTQSSIAGATGGTTGVDATGEECSPNDPYCSSTPADTYPAKATYVIGGQVPAGLKYPTGEYGIPAPGTGNVAPSCDPLKAHIKTVSPYAYYALTAAKQPQIIMSTSKPSGYAGPIIDPKENPCNWNKLKVGESVSIPLYVSQLDSEGNTVPVNVFTSGTSFSLRIRTACKDGLVYCPAGNRYRLNTDEKYSDNVYLGNDPVVAWQVTGTNVDGTETYTLEATSIFANFGLDTNLSSIIHENKINSSLDNSTFIVLESSNKFLSKHKGQDLNNITGNINDFILGTTVSKWVERGPLNKPTVKLSLIHSLLDETGEKNIPYLEYQILSSANLTTPPADTSQTIKAEGFSGEFKQVLEVKMPQESGLLEYVIQQ